MKPVEQLKHHPTVETLVDILSARTQNPDKSFFTILVCYHLTKLASMMRAKVDAQGFGNLHCNFYGINTAPSGYGKGHATKIMEEQVLHLFRNEFMEYTLPTIAEKSLTDLANKRALRKGVDEAEELDKVKQEYRRIGAYLTSFDSGTTPALKQFRHGLLMSEIGSINFESDEMANNLLSNKEILDTYLELYDGVVKPKLTKNTAESVRNEEIEGKTPTNMLMYGTASMLLDGSTTEKMFFDMLTTGYARRCFFGYSSIEACTKKLTVAERLANLTDTTSDTKLHNIAIQLHKLADPVNHNFQVRIPNDVMQAIIEYQIYCEELMESFRQSDEIRRAEARGRYFKTIRLAGAFAFLDSAAQMTMEHWEAAVKVAEMSAKCFNDLLSRDPAFARLALFLSECKEPMTHADLMEEVPYFPKASNAQKDMIKHATAWGYKNNVIIKKTFTDDIEFLQGESLQATNLDQLMLSWSKDIAVGYTPELKVPFSKLDIITKMDGGNWCNHRFLEGLRRQTHVIKGFNLLVLDIDGTATLDETKKILEDYTYYIYTTKRHQLAEDGKPAADRFRIILPMSHVLKLNIDEYKEFMHNVLETLPFETDEQTTQANRKWLANKVAQVFTNEGKLFDVLPFIPKTKKNEERKQFIDTTGSMDKLERYFFSKIEEGNRNNTIFKYGAALVDSGRGLDDLVLKIKSFNSKLPKPIPDEELNNTVIQSVTRQFYKKG
ncbi:DNA primase [Vibrio phage phi 1]|uniref:Primase C-terminal 1 domain-containing protein n=1 Tax=Vibrio phage phi 1 TaxID=1589297 RepID=A0A0B5HE08_9CAUD|nr:DNA primase [Vibrio phage phi 1]AJF40725.1 hypothetical protein SBVP1_0067 [Vibrio phage phi 1]